MSDSAEDHETRLDVLVDLLARRGWPDARPWFTALPFADRLPEILAAAVTSWSRRWEEGLEEEPATRVEPALIQDDFLHVDYLPACERWLRASTLLPPSFGSEPPAMRALREELHAFVAACRQGSPPPLPTPPPAVGPSGFAAFDQPLELEEEQPQIEEAAVFDQAPTPAGRAPAQATTVPEIEEAVDEGGDVRLQLDRASQRLRVDGQRFDLAGAPERWADVVLLWAARQADPEGWLRTRAHWTSSRLRELEEHFEAHGELIWERRRGEIRLRFTPRRPG